MWLDEAVDGMENIVRGFFDEIDDVLFSCVVAEGFTSPWDGG